MVIEFALGLCFEWISWDLWVVGLGLFCAAGFVCFLWWVVTVVECVVFSWCWWCRVGLFTLGFQVWSCCFVVVSG